MKKGVNEFKILISSPGGSVQHGLSAYNYLKGIPAKITTHNFGIVDSIAMLSCYIVAGQKRLCVPPSNISTSQPLTQFHGIRNMRKSNWRKY